MEYYKAFLKLKLTQRNASDIVKVYISKGLVVKGEMLK